MKKILTTPALWFVIGSALAWWYSQDIRMVGALICFFLGSSMWSSIYIEGRLLDPLKKISGSASENMESVANLAGAVESLARICAENRQALAKALGIKPEVKH